MLVSEVVARRFLLVCGATIASLGTFLLSSQPAFAYTSNYNSSMAANSRMSYGNGDDYCSNGGYYNHGTVWLSNDGSNYYSEKVSVAGNSTSVTVQIRGAVNSCGFNDFTDDYYYAANVAPDGASSGKLSIWGGNGQTFYRGMISANTPYNAWTSQGSSLTATLDVSGVAPCTAASGGVATGTTRVGIYRQLRIDWPNTWMGADGTEWIDVSVTRSCPYNYSLTPNIQVNPRAAEADSNVTVTRSVSKTGTDTPSTHWEEWMFTLPPGSSPVTNPSGLSSNMLAPSQQFPYVGISKVDEGDTAFTQATNFLGNPTGTQPVQLPANLPVGSQVCFTLSVKPEGYNNGAIDQKWKHRDPDCVTISKSPKIQISGGDVMVGRVVPAPSPSATISVSPRSTVGGKGYASWVEYAAFAPSPSAGGGGTANILTGGCLASDYTRSNAALTGCDASQRKLTFANNTACGASTFGCYGTMSARTDLVATYSSAPDGYTVQAAAPTIDFGTLPANARYYYKLTSPVTVSGQLKPGMSVIIVSNSLITVAGDITDNGGSYNSLDAVPQVLLLTSGNIQINDTVSNINAWLYAGDTISTCNAVQVAPSKYTDGTGVNALGAGTPCDAKPLTINGPISAGHLQLRRTYGATGASGGSPADTAEAFNLRADASLWAKNQSIATNVITTVYTQELPPRY